MSLPLYFQFKSKITLIFIKNQIQIGHENFRKSRYLDKIKGICHVYNDNRPGIGGEPLPGQRIDPPMSNFPNEHGIKVLCFDAYIKPANDDQVERCGARKCQVLFYLEDDTVQVIEPRVVNSGLPQDDFIISVSNANIINIRLGTIVRRHRIPKPPPNDACFYTVEDFNVGIDLKLYGRVYRLVSCDKFTTDFLRRLGVRINEPEEISYDRFASLRIGNSDEPKSCQKTEHPYKLQQFLDHDRQVLRFNCFWDDSDSLYGDARNFELHYFLADDTIEIIERFQPNSGRDALPCFLKRQKLPKGVPDLPLPGGGESVICLRSGCKPIEYYTDMDLTIGAILNVYGRKFMICDCDEFTKEYYRKKYNIETLKPVKPLRAKQRDSNEDTDSNCRPRMQSSFGKCDERGLYQGKFNPDILHFMTRIISGNEDAESRKFVLTCFPCDNTFMIQEPEIENSGFKSGKYMERCKVLKPGQSVANTELPEYYSPSDVYIGAHLVINGVTFEICDADVHTLNFMENHPSQFHFSDFSKIMQKMKSLVCNREEEVRRMAKEANSENLDLEGFKSFVKKLLQTKTEEQICLVLHEIITLARHYALNVPVEIHYQDIISLIQQHLRKLSYEGFDDLLNSCKYEDYKNKGIIKSTILRRIFKANRLPISDDIIRKPIELFQDSENEMIDYKEFINQMNWKCNPISLGGLVCQYSGNLEVDMARLLGGKKIPDLSEQRVQHIAFIEDLIQL
ncbi:unnamed protein product [Rodentolepis nana]|uniref:EF-hand domain-containing family member C2 n=1 Tax=Rodentolepis nana TaxID=102285 RepID=A0A0R3T2E6_RODNA|nr:unnamed protein product [Rodentolepis nana]